MTGWKIAHWRSYITALQLLLACLTTSRAATMNTDLLQKSIADIFEEFVI